MGIESISNCNKITSIETTLFKSTGHHLRWRTNSRVSILGFHPSNMFTWHLMWRSTKANFVLFSKLFFFLFQAFSISFSYYFHFLLFVSKLNMKFCCKTFLLLIFSHITGHRTKKVLLMKFEILGLGVGGLNS